MSLVSAVTCRFFAAMMLPCVFVGDRLSLCNQALNEPLVGLNCLTRGWRLKDESPSWNIAAFIWHFCRQAAVLQESRHFDFFMDPFIQHHIVQRGDRLKMEKLINKR